MDYDQVVSTIALRLGNRPDLRAMIEAELVNVQENMIEGEENFNPYFLLTPDFQNVTLLSGEEYGTLQTSYLKPYEFGFCYSVNAGGMQMPQPLDFDTVDVARAKNVALNDMGQLTGTEPVRASLVGNRVYIWPVIQRDLTLKVRTYDRVATLRSDAVSTHPILLNASDWLMGMAGWKVALFDQQLDTAKIFLAEGEKGRKRVMGMTEELLMAQTPIYRGGAR